MGIYQILDSELRALKPTTFQSEGILERRDLQSLVRDSIDIIDPNLMVLAEEYGGWVENRCRIDLLCIDRQARLVVVELKRTEDGGYMDLQAIRYAAMVSAMTFADAVEAHKSMLRRLGSDAESAEASILDFLNWSEPCEDKFANDVRIVLVSAEFAKELVTSVMWLSNRDIDIACVKLKPYRLENTLLLDSEQIFPLPEAADYQIRIREKGRRERQEYSGNRDLTKYDLKTDDGLFENLPKLRLALKVVQYAVRRGAAPRDVLKQKGSWVAVEGEVDEQRFLELAVTARDEDSPNTNISQYLTRDNELIHHDGKTFALRNNLWGPKTVADLERIVDEFQLTDVSFEPVA